MPAMNEASQIGKIQQLADIVFNIESADTQFVSLMNKDPKPHQMLSEWQVEAYNKPSHQGVLDGEDVTTFNSTGRKLLKNIAQNLRKTWRVTQKAKVTDIAGLKGEVGHQKALCLKDLKRAMEACALSNLDCLEEADPVASRTRGAAHWLESSAQTLYPVPDGFRPASAINYTGTLAAFSEDELRDRIDLSFRARKTKVSLDAICGSSFKSTVDDFSVLQDAGASNVYPVRTFNQNSGDRKIVRVVDVLEFSSGRVRLHPSTYLYIDQDGEETAYTHRSALFLDLRMWHCGFNMPVNERPLPDLGGGPRGLAECIWVIKCGNPLGQFKCEISADS